MTSTLTHSRGFLRTFQCTRIPIRCLSTPTSDVKIPPESPKFIEVPQPLQWQAYKKPPVKGILPLPRQIFPERGTDKTSPEYIARLTRETTKPKTYRSPQVKALADWKSRQSAIRRRNLRESIAELHQRKVMADRRRDWIAAQKRAAHEILVAQPEREDERLTNPTILNALRPGQRTPLPDPKRAERVAAMKARYAAKEAAKHEERQNDLHSLYMTARDFIVTEEQLERKVEEVFEDPWFKKNPEHSIWDKEGYPDTAESMLVDMSKARKGAVADITRERAKRLAEELIGGKM
jgi:hypothetical protein